MIDLAEGQFELTPSALEEAPDGLHMGRLTPVEVRDFDPGSPDLRSTTKPRPMRDGIAFGRSFRDGRLYTLDLTAHSWTPALDPSPYGESPGEHPAAEALDVCDRVESAWAADQVRLVPGAVQVLRWRAAGRTRRVYGRANRCAPAPKHFNRGTIPITADFQAEGDLVYSDLRTVISVGIAPSSAGGALFPVRWPLLWTNYGQGRAGLLTVGGTRATWPTITINGPRSGVLVNPEVVIGGFGSIKISTTLSFGQSIVLDTRPWAQGVRRSDGASLAGKVALTATPLAWFRLPPGSWSFALRGVDPSGTSSMDVEVRDAFSSI